MLAHVSHISTQESEASLNYFDSRKDWGRRREGEREGKSEERG